METNPENSEDISMAHVNSSSEDWQTDSTISSRNDHIQGDKYGKGLRHFAVQVLQHVEKIGVTTYNDVADNIVSQYFNTPMQDVNAKVYDPKNVRRRVHDALNVLIAINAIAKTPDKRIRWVGLPKATTTVADHEALLAERDLLRKRCQEKTSHLNNLIMQEVCLKKLAEKNILREKAEGVKPARDSIVRPPFLLVNTNNKTTVDCNLSSDRREYLFEFDGGYEINDDDEVFKRMGLLMGLDRGECTAEDVEKAVSLMPGAYEQYVRQLAHGQPAANDVEESLVVYDEDGPEKQDLDSDFFSIAGTSGCEKIPHQ